MAGPVEKRRPVEGTRRPRVSVHARSAAGRPAGVQTGAVEGALWEREDTLMLAKGDPKPRNAAVVRAPSSAYLQIICPRPGAPARSLLGLCPTLLSPWSSITWERSEPLPAGGLNSQHVSPLERCKQSLYWSLCLLSCPITQPGFLRHRSCDK